MKKRILLFLTISLFLTGLLQAFEESLMIGREDQWSHLQLMDGVTLQKGREAFLDLYLRDGEYTSAAGRLSPDLILHFNGENLDDPGPYYRWQEDTRMVYSPLEKVMGEGALAFELNREMVVLIPQSQGIFGPGTLPGDFSLEFWAYPARLSQGEGLFLWEGAWKGENFMLPQSLDARFSGQRLVWTFRNFFLPPFGGETEFILQGSTRLLPRKWHHHLIRYESTSGLLEYLIDGVPEAVLYTTSSGTERGEIYLPFCGDMAEPEITLGDGFVGLMDELRLSSSVVKEPQLERFLRKTGSAMTGLIDLGHRETKLVRFETVQGVPSDSAVYYFYRLSDEMYLREDSALPWKEFVPGKALPERERGRYLQILIQLLTDGTASSSPRVSQVEVIYEPELPPLPPSYLAARPGDGTILLEWKSMSDSENLGYRIYFGDKPGFYFGSSSSAGKSPLDVGNVTAYRLEGLENGKLYYFAVVAYQEDNREFRSEFSREVSARPSHLYRESR